MKEVGIKKISDLKMCVQKKLFGEFISLENVSGI
jgi:hypothetical protein